MDCRYVRRITPMAFWDRATRLVEDTSTTASQARALAARAVPAPYAMTAGLVPSWEDFQGFSELSAMQVPAFARGVRLIAGTVAQLPLMQVRHARTVPNPFLTAPEPDRVRWVTIERTVRDLILYGRAYWLVADVDSQGYPAKIRVAPAADASKSPSDPSRITIGGRTHTISHPAGPGTQVGHVIEFTGFKDGVLITGRQAIDTALALENAARNLADSPIPSVVLKNNGADLSRDEVIGLLTDWEASRRERSTAYLNSVISADTMGWSSKELQLVEARAASAMEMARILGLDPYFVGAGVPGSALTYQNRVDMRTDLVDLTLSDYISPIEQRLSARDTTATDNTVRFDTAEFLRANLDSRSRIAIDLHTAGIIDRDEARFFVSDMETGDPINGGPA